jgi:hypothetical protein
VVQTKWWDDEARLFGIDYGHSGATQAEKVVVISAIVKPEQSKEESKPEQQQIPPAVRELLKPRKWVN